ncbi:MAG: DNA/RNA nuclease SfsA [Amaricoccus sp.]
MPSLPNRLVAEALAAGGVPRLAGYARVRPEVRYGAASRVDFVLSAEGRADAYVEVKNVHFQRRPGLAEFPDAATARGARHLRELAAVAAAGQRAALLYVVQRTDCTALRLAADRDPVYAAASAAARALGVEVLAHAVRIGPAGIWLDRELPFEG